MPSYYEYAFRARKDMNDTIRQTLGMGRGINKKDMLREVLDHYPVSAKLVNDTLNDWVERGIFEEDPDDDNILIPVKH